MNRQGPGTQASMRSLGFPPNAMSRLPNGKLAGPAGWGPPGVPSQPGRPNMSLSFSQSITQPGTPLDLSEFPALGPQQNQTQAAQAWNRISTQSPSQVRPSADDMFQSHIGGLDDFRLPSQQQAAQQAQQQQQSSQMHPNSLNDFPALPRVQNGQHVDLSHPDGHQQARNAFMAAGAMGQQQQQSQVQVQAQAQAQARQQQQQQASLRQTLQSPSNLQNVSAQQSRLLPNEAILQQQSQQQHAPPQQASAQPQQPIQQQSQQQQQPTNIQPPSTPQQAQNPNAIGEQDKKIMSKTPVPSGNTGAPGLMPNMNVNATAQQPPIQSQNQQQQQAHQQQLQQQQQSSISSQQLGPLQQMAQQQRPAGLGGNSNGTITARPPGNFGDLQRLGGNSLSRLSDSDRFGLVGLTEAIKGDNPDSAMLALGTDLTQLGLDLSQPDSSNTPLWAAFASPFADPESKPIEPEFTLPACYSVSNIQPLSTKVNNFSDETLFYIFYTMPQDIMQEVVASELTSRNWRYHTGVRLWLTKEPGSTPTQLTDTSEKGTYIFWDPTSWDRHRETDFVVDYNALAMGVAY